MADIKKYLDDIMKAVYGEQVRGSIHDAIDAINTFTEEGKVEQDEAITEGLKDILIDLKTELKKMEDNLIKAGIRQFGVVDTLPSSAEASDGVIYFYFNEDTEHYDMYAKIKGTLELIDDTTIDTTGFVTKEEIEPLKTKLDGISEGAQVNTIESISVNGTPAAPDEAKNVDVKAYNEDNKPEVGGRNLIIRYSENTGYYINQYGKENIIDFYSTSDYIKVKPKEKFVLQSWNNGFRDAWVSPAWYTEEKTYIGGYIEITHPDYMLDNIISPDNAAFVRISYYTQNIVKLERGEIATDWSPAPEDLAPIDEQKILAQIADRTYQGTDLTVKFKSEIDGSFSGNPWAWIQDRINNANWDGLHVCDYIPFTTTNNVTMQAQIAGIDTYYQYSDRPVPHHIDFITREIWPTLHAFNPVNYNNGTAAQNFPWLASDMYLWLNSLSGLVPNEATVNPETIEVDYTADGVYYFLPDELKEVIIEKRLPLEARYNASSLLTTSPGWDWQNEGKLWLPTEMEVYGTNVWGGAGYPTGGGIQYPIFANSMNRLKCRSGRRDGWWVSAPCSGNSTHWCYVNHYGLALNAIATGTWSSAPVCFRIASNVETLDMPVEGPEMTDEYMQHEMEE